MSEIRVIWLYVQQRMVYSAGGSPVRVRVRNAAACCRVFENLAMKIEFCEKYKEGA